MYMSAGSESATEIFTEFMTPFGMKADVNDDTEKKKRKKKNASKKRRRHFLVKERNVN